MRSIPLALVQSYQSGSFTPAILIRLERLDGLTLGFSDADVDIEYQGVVFKANFGMTPSAIQDREGFASDNLDMQTVLDSDMITEKDIRAGLWDRADVRVWRVDRRNISAGHEILRTGTLGEIKTGTQQFYAELRGLTQMTQTMKGPVYQAGCDAALGDSRCKVNIEALRVSGTVTDVANGTFSDSSRTEADHYFQYGVVTFTSGQNAGRSFEVSDYLSAGKLFRWFLSPPNLVSVGDTYTVVPGCDKLITTCRVRYNNKQNYRGFPFVPGDGKLYQGPPTATTE